MSKIALTPNTSGTGTLTIAAPNTSTDRTLTLPDATTTLVGTDATQTLSNKTIAASQLTGALPAISGAALTNLPAPAQLSTATGSAPSYSCRAWVNFNGTGTVAIRASGNVTSITDGGVGIYTVNFTTAMPDANYATDGTCSLNETATLNNIVNYSVSSRATSSVSIICGYQSDSSNFGIISDCSLVSVAIFR